MNNSTNKTIILLKGIYNTLQDIEVKGEKNCSYIIGMGNAIMQHIEELKQIEKHEGSIE